MLIEALQSVLTTNSSMIALLGTTTSRPDGSNGVWPTQAPDQPTMPYVVISEEDGAALQESLQGTGALQTERWKFSCHGSTYKQAKTLAKALVQVMISLNGVQSAGSVQIQGVWKKLEADDAEPIGKGTMFETHVVCEINYIDLA